jgi:predicted RNase H-like nuclease
VSAADRVFVGVVPSSDRWVAVAFHGEQFEITSVHDDIGDCWLRYGERAERLLVGVPVGLFEEGDDAGERPPDRLARGVLGPRATTVHAPPVREATHRQRYAAAKRLTERTTGTTLSRAAFELGEAVAAVDDLLAESATARETVVEAHPELCFRALADGPLEHDRDIASGYAERLRALAAFDPKAPRVVQKSADLTDGAPVSVGDVLDAAALAYTARPGPGELRSLPPDPKTDVTGLPMRTVYRAGAPLTPD